MSSIRRVIAQLKLEYRWAYAVLVLLGLFVFFALPDLLVSRSDFEKDSDWYKARDDVRTAGIQMLGGFVLVGGTWFTARTLSLAREGHITDRFSKAVEHLGAGELASQLGGIYALKRIMKDAPAEQGSVLEILTAFVRVEAGKARPPGTPPPVEVAAALRVIGQRDTRYDPRKDVLFRLNLSETNLSYASMRDSNYDMANLWRTNLEHAHLVRSTFTNALLGSTRMNNAEIDGATFAGAKYDANTEWPAGTDPAQFGAASTSHA